MRYLWCIVLFLFTTAPVWAWQPSIGINAGTQGGGLTLATPVVPGWINLTAQGNYFSLNHDINTSSAKYNGDVRLATGGLIVKVFPFHGGFNLQAGGYYNRNRIEVKGRLKDNEASPGRIKGDVDFRKFAPYAGIGWGNTVDSGRFTFTAALGVMFQGRPDVSLHSPTDNKKARKEISKEEKELQDKVDDFRYYPVLRLGLAFKL